jgi:hypothetical protein
VDILYRKAGQNDITYAGYFKGREREENAEREHRRIGATASLQDTL